MNRRVRLSLVLAMLVSLALASLGGAASLRAWRARQPFVMADDDASFTPGHIVVGGDVVAARERDPQSGNISGCLDQAVGPRVRLYSLEARRSVGDLVDPDEAKIAHMALSPSGELLATVVALPVPGGARKLRLWRVATREVLWTVDAGGSMREQVRLVEFARSGASLTVNTTRGVDRLSAAGVRAGHLDMPDGHADWAVFLAGSHVAFKTERSGPLNVYSLASDSPLRFIPSQSGESYRFSSSGEHYATEHGSGRFTVHELPSGTMIADMTAPGTLGEIVFSSEDRLLAIVVHRPDESCQLDLFDLERKRLIPFVENPPAGVCGAIGFATDRLVAVYSGKIHVFPLTRW